ISAFAAWGPNWHLAGRVKAVWLERPWLASRNRQLCCVQAIRHGNLVGIIGVLQMNATVCHPANFQLAVPPQGRFRGQIPLPTIGLLGTWIESLVRRTTQRNVKRAALCNANVSVPGMQRIRSSVRVFGVDNS